LHEDGREPSDALAGELAALPQHLAAMIAYLKAEMRALPAEAGGKAGVDAVQNIMRALERVDAFGKQLASDLALGAAETLSPDELDAVTQRVEARIDEKAQALARHLAGEALAARLRAAALCKRCAAALMAGQDGEEEGMAGESAVQFEPAVPDEPSGEHKMTAADGIAGGQNNEDVKPWPMTRAPDSVPAAWMAQTTSTIDQAIRKAIQSDIERAQLHQKGDAEAMRRTGIARQEDRTLARMVAEGERGPRAARRPTRRKGKAGRKDI